MREDTDIPGIRAASVSAWFEANIAGARLPLRFELIVGGHSNLTYKVTDDAGRHYVLRRPPLGAVIATAHDMAREHKIITGVGKSSVPVPRALGLCEDESINDAPFYIMSFVDGVVLTDAEVVEEHFAVEKREAIGVSAIEILADLHRVDPDSVGLGDLGRKENYLARQLKRWKGQWDKTKTRELSAMEEVVGRLERHMPPQQGATIVHGDYRLGNMLTGPDSRITAVLDWELCTLGDPLADLGYLLNNWVHPGEDAPTTRGAAQSPSQAPGFVTRDELVERYAKATGLDVSRAGYYQAFQYWRLAAIVEGVLARYLKGVMADEADTDAFREQVEGLAGAALELAEGF